MPGGSYWRRLFGVPGAQGARDILKPSPVTTALSSTTISGYVDTSAIWNPGTGNANAPGYIFGAGGSAKTDGFNLNVVKLVLEKDPDLSDPWSAGYKIDLLFGPDAATYGTQPFETCGPNGQSSNSGLR